MTGATFTIGTDGRGRGTISVPVNGVMYHFVFYFISPRYGLLQEQPASDLTKRARNGEFVFQTVAAPIQIPATGLTFVAGTRADTATSLNSVAVFQLNGAASPVSFTGTADASKTGLPSHTPVPGTGTGTLTITDSTNGRGTITATTRAIGGSAGAVFYVEDPHEVLVMGTDSTLTDPQIITLDQ